MAKNKKLLNDKNSKIIIILALILLIVFVVFFGIGRYAKMQSKSDNEQYQKLIEQMQIENEDLKAKLLELAENNISMETIRENIRSITQMSVLEYNYTSVIYYSTDNKLWDKVKIPFTNNRFIATIDGKIVFGFDADMVSVEESDNKIKVTCPHAKVLHSYTDNETLMVLDEKQNIFNPVDAKDYNNLLVDVEKNEREKAIKNGMEIQADERVKAIIVGYIKSVYGATMNIEFEFVG